MLRQFLRNLADWLDPPEPVYAPVTKADAIAELCLPTGDRELDVIHIALIDLVQSGMVVTVRDTQNQLRFTVTPAGKVRIREITSGELGNDTGKSLHPDVAGGRCVRGG